MRSDREVLMDGLTAVESGYRALSAFPLETLSRTELHSLLARLEELDKEWVALDRKLIGRLVTQDSTRFGGGSLADVLSKRLRISPGEARRRIAESAG